MNDIEPQKFEELNLSELSREQIPGFDEEFEFHLNYFYPKGHKKLAVDKNKQDE